jgi:hexosaminidase
MQMLERLAGHISIEPLKVLADVVEPVKNYERGRTREYTQLTPLNRLVDAVRPESDAAREFAAMSDDKKRELLRLWAGNHALLLPIIRQSPLLQEIEPLSKNLSDVAEIGLRLLQKNRQPFSEREKLRFRETLDNAAKSVGALQLMIVPTVKQMFESATK